MQRFRSYAPAGVLLPLFVLALALLEEASVLMSGADHSSYAAAPTPPADCFVSDEPTAGGPAAPGDLDSTIVFESIFLANFELHWDDNSADETCFVIEARSSDAPLLDYEVIALLPPNTTSYSDGPYNVDDFVMYRLYAANATARSEYSNSHGTGIPPYEPTPSPTPPATPTPTPEKTASPSPPPSPAASPTPAQLPEAGGPAERSSTPAAILIIAGAALLVLSAAVVVSQRQHPERG